MGLQLPFVILAAVTLGATAVAARSSLTQELSKIIQR